ncbi:hypothetical protein B0H16DRAFT_1308108 [Mycena metata]|uniref:Uncharacterized protein n=1 Tax=Mycena metata TaxID=1033252 RepID=A0AAD7NN19_9AGAR|nr:hypothetical protein B0H16DRAFT_1308108 [Mycena metata]
MRQKDQSESDDKLRLALSNMRYAACTNEDIVFLKSRVAGFRSNDPRLDSGRFRNVSIITAWNSQKDVINRLGAKRFAADVGQELISFCSIDRMSPRAVDKNKWKTCEQSVFRSIGPRLQRRLWDAPPSSNSEMMPGRLSLCIGMPFLLRSNDATELCMTKGQEAFVVGWDESTGPQGQRVLDTLFVRLVLDTSARVVQIPGLPENIVPLIRGSVHTTVLLEDDTLLSIVREQVTGLLNFSITDYTAQGKSRPENPVDLTNCKDHRAYYVALSRATTAEGTIVLQDFTTDKITCGLSGHLRQELRELELLDEITKLRTEGKLPLEVAGLYRRQLISSFARWKGQASEPVHYHPIMRYDPKLDSDSLSPVDYAQWRPSVKSVKRTLDDKDVGDVSTTSADAQSDGSVSGPKKKQKISTADTSVSGSQALAPVISRPIGMAWDAIDYSCGYDSTFGILANMWMQNKEVWSPRFCTIGLYFQYWNSLMRHAAEHHYSLEGARDRMRATLHTAKPQDFPYGPNGTTIDRIARIMFPETTHAEGVKTCSTCGYVDPEHYELFEPYMCAALSNNQIVTYPGGVPVSAWIHDNLSTTHTSCPICALSSRRVRLTMHYKVSNVPPVMFVTVDCGSMLYNKSLHFDINGAMVISRLRGIIYGGDAHFTSRYISAQGSVWFHDGMTTVRSYVEEGHIDSLDVTSLRNARGKSALVLVYAREE